MIRPSKKVGGKPRGIKRNPFPNDDAETVRGILRENEAADILARNGYDVEQNPFLCLPGIKNPDYRIEGILFDCYAPKEGTNARNIASNIKKKVFEGQANNIVLNLKNSDVLIESLRQQFINYPILGLNEIIIITNTGTIIGSFL